MNEFQQKIFSLFLTHEWRLTAGVRNIADILETTQHPVSVEEMKKILKKKNQSIDTTTIHRILHKLEKVCLVHNLRGKYIRCIAPQEKRQHHFLLCEKCGRAEEFFLDYQSSITQQLAQEKDFLLREVEMYFWGICKHCS
jgi:Fur family ferric uptake transcriptional regulator